MHILVINPYLVGNYSLGGAKRIFRMVRYLARTEKVSFASFSDQQGRSTLLQSEVYDLCHKVVTVPLTKQGLLRKAFNFFRPGPASHYYYRSGVLQQMIDELVQTEGIDFVHVEFFEMAPFACNLPRPVPRVLVSQEISSFARKFAIRPADSFKNFIQTPKLKRYEQSVAANFDRVYCITDEECNYMREQGVRHSRIYSHVVDTGEFRPSGRHLEREDALLFLGNFDHKPNSDALFWFIKDIFPLIRENGSQAVLHVVGPNLDQSMLHGLDTSRIIFHGEVAELTGYYDMASIFVNPIVSGGGMRGKVLEAMAKSKAVVSTRLGVQGIQVSDGKDVVLAETPREFANGILSLLINPEKRQSLGRQARETVCARYDEQIVFEKLLNEYREIAGGSHAR